MVALFGTGEDGIRRVGRRVKGTWYPKLFSRVARALLTWVARYMVQETAARAVKKKRPAELASRLGRKIVDKST